MSDIFFGDSLEIIKILPDESIDLVLTDPPFGTQDKQQLNTKKGGVVITSMSYEDKYTDYIDFLRCHVSEFKRVLKKTGTMYLHLDWHWVHYAKVMCDDVFGRDNFLNEIVWSYDFGSRGGKDRFPRKHDTILVYTKLYGEHIFNWDEIDRLPYQTPAMQYVGRSKEEAEKRIALGKVPTDVWTMSIVGTNAKERVGYPNQKPIQLFKRMITASTNKGALVLDPFAGSGTTGAASLKLDREFILVDNNPQSFEVLRERFKSSATINWHIENK
jgi:site-specific DNA-methyltransferase (adenine-specific)